MRIRKILRPSVSWRKYRKTNEGEGALLGAHLNIEFHRPKPLRAARRKPGQGPPRLRRLFRTERHPAGGQCANRVRVPNKWHLDADVRLARLIDLPDTDCAKSPRGPASRGLAVL
jgi:hypothetical protein